MKKYSIFLFLILSILLVGCNSKYSVETPISDLSKEEIMIASEAFHVSTTEIEEEIKSNSTIQDHISAYRELKDYISSACPTYDYEITESYNMGGEYSPKYSQFILSIDGIEDDMSFDVYYDAKGFAIKHDELAFYFARPIIEEYIDKKFNPLPENNKTDTYTAVTSTGIVDRDNPSKILFFYSSEDYFLTIETTHGSGDEFEIVGVETKSTCVKQ